MKHSLPEHAGVLTLGLVAGLALTATHGCDQDSTPYCQVGLVCPYEGIHEGNASISGITNFDRFFAAVVNVPRVSASIGAEIGAEMQALARSLELDANASSTAIRAALQARLSAAVSGDLTIAHAPVQCRISAEATVATLAGCDPSFEPGDVAVGCKGICTVSAGCGANATVTCLGPAPLLQCDGTCTGTCAADGGVVCAGTCHGGCTGTCAQQNGNGDCAGACVGTCTGTCVLATAAACSGDCEGDCASVPVDGTCDAGAETLCTAPVSGSTRCDGQCDGEVLPPASEPVCEAAIRAEVNTNVECRAPVVTATWQWSAGYAADSAAQAEFMAWLVGFKRHVAALVTATRRAELVVTAGMQLGVAAKGPVHDALETALGGDFSLKDTVGLGCAWTELANVDGVLSEAVALLRARVNGATAVLDVVAGG